MKSFSSRLTVFLISSGEPSRDECRRRLLAQDVRFRLEEIANVTPMDRAFQNMLDRCKTDLYVQVDADMLLEPWAIRRLVEEIDRQPADVALFVGWLWGDSEERPIQGVKIYRHAITRRFPYVSSLSCEMPQITAMKEAGFSFASQSQPTDRVECYGMHYSLQSPEMAFVRQQRLAHKFRTRPYMSWWTNQPKKLRDRWIKDPTPINEAAIMGALAGLAGPMPTEKESDASLPNQDFRRAMLTMGSWCQGPVGLNLFVTDKCNAHCPHCWLTGHPSEDPQELSSLLVESMLDTFPTVRNVCLAGFGEPLMHQGLGKIIAVCHDRDRPLFTGIITNGLLLKKRMAEMNTWDLRGSNGQISVSLNATTAEEHSATQGGTDAWKLVLDGIREAIALGMTVGASYICTRQNAARIPALIELAQQLGLKFLDLPNLLPHNGVNEEFRSSVLTVQSPELEILGEARNLPGADLVRHWTTPIDLTVEPPRKCDSPFTAIGVNCKGYVTGCRRMSCGEFKCHYTRKDLWNDLEYSSLRLAMCGDRPLPEQCKACFGCWSG